MCMLYTIHINVKSLARLGSIAIAYAGENNTEVDMVFSRIAEREAQINKRLTKTHDFAYFAEFFKQKSLSPLWRIRIDFSSPLLISIRICERGEWAARTQSSSTPCTFHVHVRLYTCGLFPYAINKNLVLLNYNSFA